jgi:signal transduction histidine kinase
MKTGRALRGIAFRFWLLVSLLLTVLMLAGAGIEARLAYLQSVEAAERLQQTEARAAADRIGQYLKAIEAQVHDAATLAWDSGALSAADLQEEFHRVMKLVPAIAEMRSVDALGRERLYVSRVDRDRVESRTPVAFDGTGLRNGGVAYGPVVSREGAHPFASLVIRERDGKPGGVTIAELDLKFVTDVVQGIAVGRTGNAYVVDRDNRLVAHPDLSLVLRSTNLTQLPHVAKARAALAANPASALPTQWSRSIDGHPVLVSAAHVPGPDWLLFAEEPEAEALEPVRQILYRTAMLLVAGLVVAFLASRFLARALAKPILRLREGAARIGGGRLDARIDVKTGDEVESLAHEFNRMAERLEESHASLEAKVEARTRELAAARDQAERANAAKTRFLASASHDLRQPMHTIGLLVGILRDRTRNEEARALAEKVQASVDVMQALFSSLLDISKLDAGAIKPTIADFRIDEVLRRIDVNYAPHAAEKGLELRIVGSRAVVQSDAIMLERIVGNLVTNAVRYTSRGRVLVGCRRASGMLRILVCDTGVGIAAEHLDAVFDEFVQLANPERQRSNGLGLGLSIVKRSADLLGHALIVRSTTTRRAAPRWPRYAGTGAVTWRAPARARMRCVPWKAICAPPT